MIRKLPFHSHLCNVEQYRVFWVKTQEFKNILFLCPNYHFVHLEKYCTEFRSFKDIKTAWTERVLFYYIARWDRCSIITINISTSTGGGEVNQLQTFCGKMKDLDERITIFLGLKMIFWKLWFARMGKGAGESVLCRLLL